MKKKTVIICIAAVLVVVIAFAFLYKDNLIRACVSACRNHLQTYAQQMLKDKTPSGKYGPWETLCYPEEGMVEFLTGGAGLAPNATYKGFYYSADNTHKPFSAAEGVTLTQTDADNASWTDGTDNHGISVRITENWFWFEASF